MADVRSMLRLEREKRKITHPHASYTSDGKLLCNLCEVLVKSETAWQSHLHSSQHALRLNRTRDALATRGTDGGSRKRKASDLGSPAPEERKKPKAATPPPSSPLANKGDSTEGLPGKKSVTFEEVDTAQSSRQTPDAEEEAVGAAQLAAFDRELADMEAEIRATAAPTISAAPMTAAEVAAQAREEQSTQRGKREAELEAEKEDAARLLEDEFEQMETLENRVRKLRERREELRDRHGEVDNSAQDSAVDVEPGPQDQSNSGSVGVEAATADGEDVDADDEDDESEDDWNFGAR